MEAGSDADRCLAYVAVPHLGFGWVQTCVSILENFPPATVSPTIVIPKAFRKISPAIDVRQVTPDWLPYRILSGVVRPALDYYFKNLLALSDPRRTIVYFWPAPSAALVRYAKARGFVTVREMINTCLGTVKPILEEAYDRVGLPMDPDRRINNQQVSSETEELKLHDYIISPSPRVMDSLIESGIEPGRILSSTYGWSPDRFALSQGERSTDTFKALFVGTDAFRKGLPQVLAAWQRSAIKGQLILVGKLDDSLAGLLDPYVRREDVKLIEFSHDVGSLYKSADVFVFPSLEEGGPQVTYEAAGCGLPVITTPMGSGNIIKDGVNGFVVDPYDVEGLADALRRVAASPELRKRLGRQAAAHAQDFTYEKIGQQRSAMFSQLLNTRQLTELG